MTEKKRCVPCVEKKLRQAYKNERMKNSDLARRIKHLEKEVAGLKIDHAKALDPEEARLQKAEATIRDMEKTAWRELGAGMVEAGE